MFGSGCRLSRTPPGENPVHPVNPVQISVQGEQFSNVVVCGILAGLGIAVNCVGPIMLQRDVVMVKRNLNKAASQRRDARVQRRREKAVRARFDATQALSERSFSPLCGLASLRLCVRFFKSHRHEKCRTRSALQNLGRFSGWFRGGAGVRCP